MAHYPLSAGADVTGWYTFTNGSRKCPARHVQRHGYGYRHGRAGISMDRCDRAGDEHHLDGHDDHLSTLPHAGQCLPVEI